MFRRLLPAVVLCASLGVTAPAHPLELNGQSGGYLFRGPVKGLVTVTQQDAKAVLAFNLFGLQPKTRYQLSGKRGWCDDASPYLALRSFTTDGKGRSWDPVKIRVDATAIKSVAIRERASGRTIACANRTISVGPENASMKIDRPKAVVMISEANALWQLIESFSGLQPSTRYRTVALPGGCVPGSQPLFGKTFRSNVGGDAVVRVKREQVSGKSIGALALIDTSTGEITFCRTV
ncbi:MAG: hypothetical protein IPG68_02925 [Micrococcales bacterium]|nr:hypothetical protein [Micrococcales bacterium]